MAIRSALRARLLKEQGQGPDFVIVEELGVYRGQVRLDVAVVNGLLHGYEIKSDRDNLRRLPKQVDVYGKVLDRATLVVGDRFVAASTNLVPKWWGVLHASRQGEVVRFQHLRRPLQNPHRDARVLAELLWFDYAIELLEQRNATHGVRRKSRRVVWDRICDHFSVDEIATAVRRRLKATRVNQALA